MTSNFPMQHGNTRLLAAAVVLGLVAWLAGPAQAQYADLDRADWVEDDVPPPPEYGLHSLVDIEMPHTSNIRMGLVPDSLQPNVETGIVRYVVVSRGPSAVNASYEGIRCATGEYRIYARQVQGGEWIPARNSSWKAMRGTGGVQVPYPYQLARNGLCLGPAIRTDTAEILRELKSGNRSLYY